MSTEGGKVRRSLGDARMRSAQTESGDATGATVDTREAERFARMAEQWWDPDGDFRPLHRFNPTRVRFVRDRVAAHFGRDVRRHPVMTGLSVLDVGCGGGLLSEPMARMGATVTGIDVTELNIGVARLHAERSGLAIDYSVATAEELADEGRMFDIVLAMEVVEHVADVNLFLAACSRLVAPGGLLFIATINRTARSLLLAKIGAEYVLRWLPPGTHDWRRFLKPSEIVGPLRANGLRPQEVAGTVYNPLTGTWSVSRDVAVNYMVVAERPAA